MSKERDERIRVLMAVGWTRTEAANIVAKEDKLMKQKSLLKSK